MLHRHGTMRLATARDEIEPLRDGRINGPDDPYLTDPRDRPGHLRARHAARVTPNEVEGLFAADLAFLQDLYGIINFGDPADVEALQAHGRRRRARPPEPQSVDDEWAATVGRRSGDRPRIRPLRRPAGRAIEEVPSRSSS